MLGEHGQATVEWTAAVLLLAVLLTGVAVAVDASWLPGKLRCAVGWACAVTGSKAAAPADGEGLPAPLALASAPICPRPEYCPMGVNRCRLLHPDGSRAQAMCRAAIRREFANSTPFNEFLERFGWACVSGALPVSELRGAFRDLGKRENWRTRKRFARALARSIARARRMLPRALVKSAGRGLVGCTWKIVREAA